MHLISIYNAIIISLGIGTVLLLLQPFGLTSYQGNKILASFGFTLVSFVCIVSKSLFVKQIIKNRKVKWSIIKEIFSLSLGLIIISIGNYIYLSIIIPTFSLTFINLINSVVFTFSIGIITISFIVLYRYNMMLNNKLGTLITSEIEANSNQSITFVSTNKTDEDFTILKKDFLFVESIKNNIHIYYYDSNMNVKTKSIRNTLKNIEEGLSDSNISRCHRSFLVNIANVQKYKGNSNGYRIYFKNYNNFVPVSRSYSNLFKLH